MTLFPASLLEKAKGVLTLARARGLTICTGESCTGGLVAGLLTEIPGASDVLDRAFITYSNEAKTQMLGVDPVLIGAHGAVSEQVAQAMARGALQKSGASLAVAITGVAGPGGGTPEKPVGLVHFAVARGDATRHAVRRFGEVGRTAIRLASVETALDMIIETITAS